MLHPEEVDGEGLKEIWSAIKAGAKKIGKFYKEHKSTFAPIVKGGIERLLDAGEAALSVAQPELIPAIAGFHKYVREPAVSKLGKVTGAYGLGISQALNCIMRLRAPGRLPQVLPCLIEPRLRLLW